MQISILLWTTGYSLVTLLIAIWRKVFLKKDNHVLQWVGVFVLLIGVIFETIWSLIRDIQPSPKNFSQNLTSTAPGKDSEINIVALFFGFACALCFSVNYVLAEKIQQNDPEAKYAPIRPLTILSFNAACGFFGAVMYIIIYTIPNWSELVSDPITSMGGDLIELSWTWLVTAVLLFIHFWSFYEICKVSALHAGVSKAVESSLVFFLSHVLYCHPIPSINVPGSSLNCMNGPKLSAVGGYVVGMVLYIIGHQKLSHLQTHLQKDTSNNLDFNLLQDVAAT
jgi:drug/metabolite transporter (DMT)-like permease